MLASKGYKMSAINSYNTSHSSILAYTKAKKEAKQSSSLNFANVFAQNLNSKLYEIQQDNALQNALSEAKIEYKNKNLSSLNTEVKKADLGIISALSSLDKTVKSNFAYGYSVDEKGFMGADFNLAANIPLDFKIHKSTLDEMERYAQNKSNNPHRASYVGAKSYFAELDMAHIIGQNYNLFADFAKKASFFDKDSFSQSDLEALPKGVEYSKAKFDVVSFTHDISEVSVTHIYKNEADIKEKNDIYLSLMTMGIDYSGVLELDFNTNMKKDADISSEFSFNPDFSMYENEDGSKSLESLFLSFIKSSSPALGGGDTKLDPKVEIYNMAMEKLSKHEKPMDIALLNSQFDFMNYILENANSDRFSTLHFSLWAEENFGVRGSEYGKAAAYGPSFDEAYKNGFRMPQDLVLSHAKDVFERFHKLNAKTAV